jgi:D-glycero-alpha-D-manno-heptose-7-phosphate kinase
MNLAEKINEGIKEAMKAKDTDRLRALRGIKSAFLLLQTAEGVTEVTEDMYLKSLQKLAKQRKDSLEIYEQQNREDLAQIERVELGENGGKQDQYAAAFGGFNYMEFKGDDVIVNPLRIKDSVQDELENNIVLYFTNFTRNSSDVLTEQVQKMKEKNKTSVLSLHALVEQAKMIKDCLIKGNIDDLGEILDYGFQQKKMLAKGISTTEIETLYETAIKAGATGGKISGAGGGGFMFFYCPNNTKYNVIKELDKLKMGYNQPFTWNKFGIRTWQIE